MSVSSKSLRSSSNHNQNSHRLLRRARFLPRVLDVDVEVIFFFVAGSFSEVPNGFVALFGTRVQGQSMRQVSVVLSHRSPSSFSVISSFRSLNLGLRTSLLEIEHSTLFFFSPKEKDAVISSKRVSRSTWKNKRSRLRGTAYAG